MLFKFVDLLNNLKLKTMITIIYAVLVILIIRGLKLFAITDEEVNEICKNLLK